MAYYQALILVAVVATVSSQSYGSSSLSYGHSPRAPHSGTPFKFYSSNSYPSLSSPTSLPSAGTYAPSAPLLAQYPAQQSNPFYEPSLQHLLYSNRGYDVTEAPQEVQAPPTPVPPPSPPVAFPIAAPLANQVPLPPPQQPAPESLLAGILSGGASQLGSQTSTSFSSPYVSYSH